MTCVSTMSYSITALARLHAFVFMCCLCSFYLSLHIFVVCVLYDAFYLDGHLLFARVNPQEPAATARRPLGIEVLATRAAEAIGTLDGEVQQKVKREVRPCDAHFSMIFHKEKR